MIRGDVGPRAEGRGHQAVSLSVISYSLFGRSVAISCLEDFYGFYDSPLTAHCLPFTIYDSNDFYGFYDFNDLTNRLVDQLTLHAMLFVLYK